AVHLDVRRQVDQERVELARILGVGRALCRYLLLIRPRTPHLALTERHASDPYDTILPPGDDHRAPLGVHPLHDVAVRLGKRGVDRLLTPTLRREVAFFPRLLSCLVLNRSHVTHGYVLSQNFPTSGSCQMPEPYQDASGSNTPAVPT